jgi:hypothetical protein
MKGSAGMYLSKWLRSLTNLELTPKLLVILIPRILLLITKIIMPTMMKAAKVVNEKRMLKTTNYTMKG